MNEQLEVSSVEYEKSKSCFISYGINKYKNKEYDTLHSSVIAEDARKLADAFTPFVGRSAFYTASDNPQECTNEAIKDSLQRYANEVGPRGLLIIHFSGHGGNVSSEEWTLAPYDYREDDESTHLTAKAMIDFKPNANGSAAEGLSQLSITPKPNTRLLFILDCCRAGGMAINLAHSFLNKCHGGCILSACTVDQKSFAPLSLGCSIYTYFLAEAISRLDTPTGEDVNLPLQNVHDQSYACTEAFTILKVNSESRFHAAKEHTMNPSMSTVNKWEFYCGKGPGGDAEIPLNRAPTLSSLEADLSQFLIDRVGTDIFQDEIKPVRLLSLDEGTMKFIEETCKPALKTLHDHRMLNPKVVFAALSSMMYSVAICEIGADSRSRLPSVTRVQHFNIFPSGFYHAVMALDKTITENVDKDILKEGFKWAWMEYHETLRKEGKYVDLLLDKYGAKIWPELVPGVYKAHLNLYNT